MPDERGVVRRIAWRELFPWLVLARTFRHAIAPTVLVLATLGVFVTSIGWTAARHVFLTAQQRAELSKPVPPSPPLAALVPSALRKYFPEEPNGVLEPFFQLAEPIAKVLSHRASINHVAYYLFGFLWSLAVWGFVGGYITRRTIVQTALDDTPGVIETGQFAARRWIWYCLAPLYPLLGILIVLVLHVPLGWLMRLDAGVLIAGIVWVLVLLAGVAAAWLLIGTLLGWPLMWGALSAEREGDAFEAFSRSFSYVYGKPLHYLLYAVVAAILGALGYAAAYVFIQIAYEFGFWAISWGAGANHVEDINTAMAIAAGQPATGLEGAAEKSGLFTAGIWLLSFWRDVAGFFLQGYALAYFWSAAGIIYLLLRQDVDEKEMDEVYLPDEEPLTRPPGAASSAPATPAPPPAEAAPPEATQSAAEP